MTGIRTGQMALSAAVATICVAILFFLGSERLIESPSSGTGWFHALYFILSFLLPISLYFAFTSPLPPAAFERAARLAFLLTVGLGLVMSLYRTAILARPVDFLSMALYITGAFTGVLALTWRTTGLVEVNSPPSKAIINEMLEKHRVLPVVRHVGLFIKRALDILVSFVGLLLSFPLWMFFSVAIWLEDPGPLLFAKICVTKGGRSFSQLKFRSMIKEAEKKTGPVLTTQYDPRMTRIGKLMRKTAMDELPQLLNILIGDMSFVGPRPQRTVLVSKYLEEMPEYTLRHTIRPGLTGLAQVYGHYYVTPRQKLRFDLIYVRNPSIWLDLRLFVISLFISLIGGWQNRDGRGMLLRLRRFIVPSRVRERGDSKVIFDEAVQNEEASI